MTVILGCLFLFLSYSLLRFTTLTHLPLSLLESARLIYLDLSSTSFFESLAGILKLSGLKLLWLIGCQAKIDISIVEELTLLEHLEDLTIDINNSSALKKLLSFPRLVNVTNNLVIKVRNNATSIVWNVTPMEKLSRLDLKILDLLDVRIVGNLRTECFPNLTNVTINSVHGTKDLNWLVYAPNLTILKVSQSSFEEVISIEASINASAGNMVPFGKLKRLKLSSLVRLRSIYPSSLPFHFLKRLSIYGCPNLKRLPLDSSSVADVKGLILKYSPAIWIEAVKWEDEATKQRFLPSCVGKDRRVYALAEPLPT